VAESSHSVSPQAIVENKIAATVTQVKILSDLDIICGNVPEVNFVGMSARVDQFSKCLDGFKIYIRLLSPYC